MSSAVTAAEPQMVQSHDQSGEQQGAALNDSLIITKSCARRIKQLQKAKESGTLGLRIGVEGGGCSGFQYVFKMEELTPEQITEDDRYSPETHHPGYELKSIANRKHVDVVYDPAI
jgi:Fe-S cluster assembly iron-binding protein IscA